MDSLSHCRASMVPMTTPTAPILVTGGTGRTGRRVADRLRAQGRPVRIASRTAAPAARPAAVPFDWHDDA